MTYHFIAIDRKAAALIGACVPKLATFRACEPAETVAARAWRCISCMESSAASEIVSNLERFECIELFETDQFMYAIGHAPDSSREILTESDVALTPDEMDQLKALARTKLVPWWRSRAHVSEIGIIAFSIMCAVGCPFLIGGSVHVSDWPRGAMIAGPACSAVFLALALWSARMSQNMWKRGADTIHGALPAVA